MTQSLPILLYHSVTDSPAQGLERFTVHPDQFTDHLDCLVAQDRIVMSFGQIAAYLRAGIPLPDRAAVITFDDGLADFADHAWPLLRARNLPATLYAVAGYIDDRSRWLSGGAGETRMLTGSELAALADDGVEIGAHSMTHPRLDEVSTERARREIVASRDLLEQIVGRPVTSFAYPHGCHNRQVKDLVAAAGYVSAAAVRNMLSHDRDDVFAMARLTVTDAMSAEEVGRLLQGRGVRRASGRELLRTTAWRQVRRWQHHREPAGDAS